MKDLLLGMSGITETKIAMFDIMIKLAKEQNGIISLSDLEQIKEGLIREAKSGELNDIFTELSLKQKTTSAENKK